MQTLHRWWQIWQAWRQRRALTRSLPDSWLQAYRAPLAEDPR